MRGKVILGWILLVGMICKVFLITLPSAAYAWAFSGNQTIPLMYLGLDGLLIWLTIRMIKSKRKEDRE